MFKAEVAGPIARDLGRRLLKGVTLDDGVAKADDFRIVEAERMIHVLNAPSPGATASLSIGRTIAEMATRRLDLP